MLEGKEPTPAPSLTEVDNFDLEDERARIRSELQREFDDQVATLKESWSEAQVANQNAQTAEQPMINQETQSKSQLATEHVVQQFEFLNLKVILSPTFICNFYVKFQSKMLVGGEESNNEKIKQRKKERKKHADKKRSELKRLVEEDVSFVFLSDLISIITR